MNPVEAAGAQVEAWRCVRSALTGEPTPVVGADLVQPVIQALACLAARSIAARLEDVGAEMIAKGLAQGYVEHKLSQLLLADLQYTPDEPPS
jgi:hypothetical protein